MKKCPYCSADLPDNSRFCLYCMRELSEKKSLEKNKLNKAVKYIATEVTIIFLVFGLIMGVIIASHEKKLNSLSKNENHVVFTPDETIDTAITAEINSNETQNSDVTEKTDTEEVTESETTGPAEDAVTEPEKEVISEATTVSPPIETNAPYVPDYEIYPEDPTPDPIEPQIPVTTRTPKTVRFPEIIITPETTKAPETEKPAEPEAPETEKTTENNQSPWLVAEVDGGVEIVGINIVEESGNYIIPSEIDGKTVVGIGVRAFYYNKSIKTISIPETVTYIAAQAFYHVDGLTTILIPGSVSYIGSNAFTECAYLSEVFIAAGLITIESNAFSTRYQRSVDLTIYAPTAAGLDMKAQLFWDAKYRLWKG